MPSLVAALAIGDEIFFASQLHGDDARAFVYLRAPDPDITAELNRWSVGNILALFHKTNIFQSAAYLRGPGQLPGANAHHKNTNCGEIMAVAMYMAQHNGDPPRQHTGGAGHASSRKARLAAWGNYGESPNKIDTFLVPPCAVSVRNWGCKSFLDFQGIAEVKIDRYALKKLKHPTLPINQIEPEEVKPMGVPLVDLLNAADFDDPNLDE
ncbi:MAG: hypothetical protein Q9183_004935 [Haloplaca sp. 2 TL-2023]